MMSSFATIPKTAPFAEEEIDLLNRVVGPANSLQRAWLAGFLAGVESVSGQAQPSAPARPAEPLTIIYASESGNCEKLANDLAKAARKNGLKPTLIDMADLDLARLGAAKRLGPLGVTTRSLATRASAIASSPGEDGERAHLPVSPLRQETHGRARTGVASTY